MNLKTSRLIFDGLVKTMTTTSAIECHGARRSRRFVSQPQHPLSLITSQFHSASTIGKRHSTCGNVSFRPEGVNPEDTSIILFPGQGSQFVGMGKSAVEEVPSAGDLFEIASNILGYDLLHACIHGPLDQLERTRLCQPAVVVSSLAAIERLRRQNPDAIYSCVGAAGFSVGEITALIFAGALSFEDGIRLVKVRADAMQKASEELPSSMATCFTSSKSRLDLAFETAKEWCIQKHLITNPICQTANFLYAECKVIAGHSEAIDFIQEHRSKFNIRRLKSLPLSGAFHTPLMAAARKDFLEMLKKIDVAQPAVPVYSNVSGTFYRSPEEIRKVLPNQITSPVRWEQTMQAIYTRQPGSPFPITYEVGPGTQLGSTLYMCNRKAHENYIAVGA